MVKKIRIHSSGNGAPSSNGDGGEDWSLHPGAALRRKRGISAKEQQARAKHPVVLSREIFESRSLRKKAFSADEHCLFICGEVREVLGWLHEATRYVTRSALDLSEDPGYVGREWDGAILMDVLEEFEARMKHKPAVHLGRTSPYPRMLSLRELLKALKSSPQEA